VTQRDEVLIIKIGLCSSGLISLVAVLSSHCLMVWAAVATSFISVEGDLMSKKFLVASKTVELSMVLTSKIHTEVVRAPLAALPPLPSM
jgi:hypothetical protein